MRSIRTFLPSLSFVIVVLVALVSPASAQRAVGPYEGVLGSTDDPAARHTLTFRSSIFGAWDDILTESEAPDVDRRFLREGLAGGVNGGLTHARRTGRVQWLSSADTAVRVYGSDSDATAATFTGRSALDSTLHSRVRLSLSGGWLYSPYYELASSYGAQSQSQSVGSFGGSFGLATAAERNTSTDGRAGVNVRLSMRDTVEAHVNGRHWDFLDQPESTVTSYGWLARYRHSLSRAVGVYAGFGREEARYKFADDDVVVSDIIDIGLDYGDTLAFSRRTALSFGFSTSANRWEDDTHWRVNGSATLTRAFGRSGSGLLRYSRNTEHRAGFRQPLLTDTFSGAFSDQVGRKTSWSLHAGYVRGEIGFDPESEARRFNTYDAGGRLTRALTRHLGIFGDYTYYRYEVPAGATTFTFLPKFSRQSVSFGLTLWAPIINDTRPPRDSR